VLAAERGDGVIEADTEQIEKDLERSNITAGQDGDSAAHHCSLRRLLRAWCLLRPEVGYVQGMNLAASVALEVLGGDEDAAFALFSALLSRLPADFFSQTPPLHGFNVEVRALALLLEERFPAVGGLRHLLYEVLPIWASKCFLTIWAGALSVDCVLAVWDAMLSTGAPATNLSVAAALLEPIISSVDSEVEGVDLCEEMAGCLSAATFTRVRKAPAVTPAEAARLRGQARLFVEAEMPTEPGPIDAMGVISMFELPACRVEVLSKPRPLSSADCELALRDGLSHDSVARAADFRKRLFSMLCIDEKGLDDPRLLVVVLIARLSTAGLLMKLRHIFDVYDEDQSGALEPNEQRALAQAFYLLARVSRDCPDPQLARALLASPEASSSCTEASSSYTSPYPPLHEDPQMPCALPAPFVRARSSVQSRASARASRWTSVQRATHATFAVKEQSWKRANLFVDLLAAMDLNRDGKISFCEWTYGVLAQPSLCHFLMAIYNRQSTSTPLGSATELSRVSRR